MDTNPLAADSTVIRNASQSEFVDGWKILGRLTEGKIYLCQRPDAETVHPRIGGLQVAYFEGPHPAGLVGTHIHFLSPVSSRRTVWHLNFQDVISIGRLFRTGKYSVERVISLGGPSVKNPRLLRTRLGCNTEELLQGEIEPGESRVISGSVLSGRLASDQAGFLGRHHWQLTVIPEPTPLKRASLWRREFSIHPWLPFVRKQSYRMTSALHGRPGAMVPLGTFERLMPLDILATPLLRALAVGDSERAEALGCLELEEEDLALCALVCPGKLEYGSLLRSVLDRIREEG